MTNWEPIRIGHWGLVIGHLNCYLTSETAWVESGVSESESQYQELPAGLPLPVAAANAGPLAPNPPIVLPP